MGKCRARLVFPSVVLFAEGVIKPSSPSSSSSSSSHSSFFSSVLHASSFLFPWQRRHTRTEEERGKNWQEFDSLDKREKEGGQERVVVVDVVVRDFFFPSLVFSLSLGARQSNYVCSRRRRRTRRERSVETKKSCRRRHSIYPMWKGRRIFAPPLL